MKSQDYTIDIEGVIGRIKHLISISRHSQAEFARRIGMDPSTLCKHLSCRLPLTRGLVNRIVADMGVSKEWLLEGRDVPFPKPVHARSVASAAEAVTAAGGRERVKLPVYDIDVTAGCVDLARMFTVDNLIGMIELPGLDARDVIVRVYGNSMVPVVQPGAYIAIRPITNPRVIFWGQMYVVVMDDFRMVKYLRRSSLGDDYLILHSANPDYDDMEVSRSEIRRLFIVDSIFNFDIRCH